MQAGAKELWLSCVVAFSDGKPESTFPENAPNERAPAVSGERPLECVMRDAWRDQITTTLAPTLTLA
jgi:hypothetical protein